MGYCQSGWPAKSTLPGVIKPYHQVASELTVEKGLLMRASRVVIPAALRVSILDKLHLGYQGIVKSRERAKQSVWWPGLSRQLEEVVKSCTECCKNSPPGVEPLLPSRLPQLPWQKVGTDLFEYNKYTYLLIIDYYSRWIEIAQLNKTTSEDIIRHTSSIFARHGIPEVVVSDNSPQFSSELYAKFAQQYGFEHVTSSPRYPKSYGEAERAVKTVKNFLKKSKEPYLALLAYQSTPLQNGYRPAQLLMSRNLRTILPEVREKRIPKVVDFQVLEERDEVLKDRQKKDYDARHRTKALPQLDPGDYVWLPDRETTGKVVTETAPRSLIVDTQNGTFRRNCQHLNKLPEPQEPDQTTPSEEACTSHRQTRSQTGRTPRPPVRLDPSWN